MARIETVEHRNVHPGKCSALLENIAYMLEVGLIAGASIDVQREGDNMEYHFKAEITNISSPVASKST